MLYFIYRPPPSKKNNIKASHFLPDFTELLEIALLQNDHICILGDLNISWDMIGQSERKEFASLSTSMNLHQYVEDPTHSKGHTLDFTITWSNSDVFTLTDTIHLLSDHYLVLRNLTFAKPRYPFTEIKYRKCKDIDAETFQNEIAKSGIVINQEQDIDSAVKHYNCVLSELLDKFAPLKTMKVIFRPKKA